MSETQVTITHQLAVIVGITVLKPYARYLVFIKPLKFIWRSGARSSKKLQRHKFKVGHHPNTCNKWPPGRYSLLYNDSQELFAINEHVINLPIHYGVPNKIATKKVIKKNARCFGNHQLTDADYAYASINQVIFRPDNGLSPVRRQAIIWTKAGTLFIWTQWTNFSEIWSKYNNFYTRKLIWKWRLQWPFCFDLSNIKQGYQLWLPHCWCLTDNTSNFTAILMLSQFIVYLPNITITRPSVFRFGRSRMAHILKRLCETYLLERKRLTFWVKFHLCLFQGVKLAIIRRSWWRHQMDIFFALLVLFEGNPTVNGEFSS